MIFIDENKRSHPAELAITEKSRIAKMARSSRVPFVPSAQGQFLGV